MSFDQANTLRRMAASKTIRARVLAFTSGKGGVGKTNLAVAFAIGMAQRGKKVCLVDLDLGLANADLLLPKRSRWNLAHVLAGKVSLDEALCQVMPGLTFLGGASGVRGMSDLAQNFRSELLRHLDILEQSFDIMILDGAAGASRFQVDLTALADDICLVMTPEPTSMVDGLSLARHLGFRRQERIYMVLNQVKNRGDAVKVANRIARSSEQVLGIELLKLGYVLDDPRVPVAVRQGQSFMQAYPRSDAARCVKVMVDFLLERHQERILETGFFRRLVKDVTPVHV